MKTAEPLPTDIRLMNLAATALFTLGAVLLLAAALWWAVRHPVFAVAGITVEGEVTHNNAATLRANVAPHLAGNFFTVNLVAAREAFERVPWVRHAVVRREFPNRLRVRLQEQHAVALWSGDSEPRLLNDAGEVFEANVGDVEAEELPRLGGPDAQAGEVLAMYQALQPMFEALDLVVDHMELTARGSWQVGLDNGASLELGRGTTEEVTARVQRMLQTISQVTARYGRGPEALVSADLRHADGYAVRLRGVATTADAVKR